MLQLIDQEDLDPAAAHLEADRIEALRILLTREKQRGLSLHE
jgi:hypothetical protein